MFMGFDDPEYDLINLRTVSVFMCVLLCVCVCVHVLHKICVNCSLSLMA